MPRFSSKDWVVLVTSFRLYLGFFELTYFPHKESCFAFSVLRIRHKGQRLLQKRAIIGFRHFNVETFMRQIIERYCQPVTIILKFLGNVPTLILQSKICQYRSNLRKPTFGIRHTRPTCLDRMPSLTSKLNSTPSAAIINNPCQPDAANTSSNTINQKITAAAEIITSRYTK